MYPRSTLNSNLVGASRSLIFTLLSHISIAGDSEAKHEVRLQQASLELVCLGIALIKLFITQREATRRSIDRTVLCGFNHVTKERAINGNEWYVVLEKE